MNFCEKWGIFVNKYYSLISIFLGITVGLIIVLIFPRLNVFPFTLINTSDRKVILFLIVMTPFLIGSLLNLLNKNKVRINNQGTAKFGNVGSEMDELIGEDGFVLSKNTKLSLSASFEHVSIIGPTGSGKSTGFFIPNLLELNGDVSALVIDPKGELYDSTKKYLTKKGYDLIIIKPLDDKFEFCYNPIRITQTNSELREIAQLMMMNGSKSYELSTGGSSNNAEWLAMATPLLTATMIYVKEKGIKKDMTEVLDIILNDSLDEMIMKFIQIPEAEKSFLIFNASAESEKTMSSIRVTLTNALQLFVDEKIQNFTSVKYKFTDDYTRIVDERFMFNPLVLRQKPTVVFIQIPETKSLYMMPLMSVFYSQVLDLCMGNLGIPILFLLDEFANIGILPSFSNIIATARSRKIGISIGLQGVEQLERNYGKENAIDILNNLKTKLIFSGLTGESAEYISKLSGLTTVQSFSNSRESGFLSSSGNTSVSEQRRELVTPDEVRRMLSDEVFIIAHNKNLVRDKKIKFYKDPKYVKRL